MSLENPTLQEEIAYDAVRKLGAAAINLFVEMVARGESIAMAAMLITRTPPRCGINSDAMRKGVGGHWWEGMSEATAIAWNSEYRKRTGENIPEGAVILRGFAKGIGDHEVVLTHKHDLHAVKQVLRERNVTCHGDGWDIEAKDPVLTPQVSRLAPDLVEDLRREYIKDDPSLALKDQRELREMIVEKHGSPEVKDVPKQCGKEAFADLSRKVWQERRRITVSTKDGGGGKRAKSATGTNAGT